MIVVNYKQWLSKDQLYCNTQILIKSNFFLSVTSIDDNIFRSHNCVSKFLQAWATIFFEETLPYFLVSFWQCFMFPLWRTKYALLTFRELCIETTKRGPWLIEGSRNTMRIWRHGVCISDCIVSQHEISYSSASMAIRSRNFAKAGSACPPYFYFSYIEGELNLRE